MHRGSTDRTATIVRGYAWHVYPDPATPGVFEGDNPFVLGDARGPGRPPYAPTGGTLEFWQVGKNTPGIQNDHRNGNTYLAVTELVDPPPVASGWFSHPPSSTRRSSSTSAVRAGRTSSGSQIRSRPVRVRSWIANSRSAEVEADESAPILEEC